MTDLIVVNVTAPNLATAERLARAVVEESLAACCTLVPAVRSIYRWQGAVHDDIEVLLVIKTRAALLDALTARVRALHPYTLPEVIALPIAGGSEPYLAWVRAETGA
jgi:periplasmic divalent cation tolerance protein